MQICSTSCRRDIAPISSPPPSAIYSISLQATYMKVERLSEASGTSPLRGLVGGGAASDRMPSTTMSRCSTAPNSTFYNAGSRHSQGGGAGITGSSTLSRDSLV